MPVTFDHSILAARDRHASARFLADLLGLQDPTDWGPFTTVVFDDGAQIHFAEPPVGEIQMQHYAFLVDDERFDAVLARVQEQGLRYTADPQQQRPQEINTLHGGRGFYLFDPAGHGFEVRTRRESAGG